MDGRQKQVYEAYQRVQDFLAANPVPPPGSYGEPKQLLDEALARLKEHTTDQAAGLRLGKASTQKQRALRRTLGEQHLRPIAKIANAVLQGSPGIDRATRMPSPQITTTRLIAEAGAFREAAAPYEAVFVKSGRPADFLAQLDAAAEALRQAFLGKAKNVGTAVGAGAGLGDEIRRGRSAVEMLDAIVTTTFAGNGKVLAKWRSAKRIRSMPGGNNRGTAAATTQPALSIVPAQAASAASPVAQS